MSQTVLTVDDSRVMRELLNMALSEAGYEIVQAVDGIDGLRVLETVRPDVIITDINMPNLDGFGFIKEIRTNNKFCGIPVLVLTTESSDKKKEMAREAGATGWIIKPFVQEKLIAAVRRVTAGISRR